MNQVSGQVSQTSSELKEVQVAVSHQEVTLQNVAQQIQTQTESTHKSIQDSVQQSFQTMQAGFCPTNASSVPIPNGTVPKHACEEESV